MCNTLSSRHFEISTLLSNLVFVKQLFYTRVTDSVTGRRIGSPFGFDSCRSLLYVEVENLLVTVYRRH
jgi:hypothetical protein